MTPSSSANALMPGRSRMYGFTSVPHMAANLLAPSEVEREEIGATGSSRSELYSIPLRCSSSVNEALKSELNSPSVDDAQGKVQPSRLLYSCSFVSGARETAHSITSWLARCVAIPL